MLSDRRNLVFGFIYCMTKPYQVQSSEDIKKDLILHSTNIYKCPSLLLLNVMVQGILYLKHRIQIYITAYQIQKSRKKHIINEYYDSTSKNLIHYFKKNVPHQ